MVSFKATILALVGGLTFPSLATDKNIGCRQCLHVDKDKVRLGCYKNCGKAFNSASEEYSVCREYCSDFVFEHGCCSGSCPGEANTCINNFLPHDGAPKMLARSADEDDQGPSLAQDLVPGSALVLRDEEETGLIEARGPGEVCCMVAQKIMGSSYETLTNLLLRGRNGRIVWDDNLVSGLVLIGTGLAVSFGCNKVYGVECLVMVPENNGNDDADADAPLAGGPLPGRREL